MKKNSIQLKGKQADAFNDLPEDYFKTLPGKLSHRLQNEHPAQKMRLLMLPNVIAAAFLVLLTIGTLLLFWLPAPQQEQKEVKQLASQLDTFRHNHQGEAFTAGTPLDQEQLLDAISYEEILNYMIEKEEFEF